MGAAPILSASPILQQKGYRVPGVIVLDVVEGQLVLAYDAIADMSVQGRRSRHCH
jgi:hypothetical protein